MDRNRDRRRRRRGDDGLHGAGLHRSAGSALHRRGGVATGIGDHAAGRPGAVRAGSDRRVGHRRRRGRAVHVYAIGDVLGFRHSLHRKPREAKGFYAMFAGLLLVSARSWSPGSPARATDRRGTDPGRGPAALGDGVPAAVVQRPGGARPVGQWAPAERVHLGGRRRAGVAVDRAHHERAVPGSSARPRSWPSSPSAGPRDARCGLAGRVRRYRGVAEPSTGPGAPSGEMPRLALLGRPGLSTGRRVGLAVRVPTCSSPRCSSSCASPELALNSDPLLARREGTIWLCPPTRPHRCAALRAVQATRWSMPPGTRSVAYRRHCRAARPQHPRSPAWWCIRRS